MARIENRARQQARRGGLASAALGIAALVAASSVHAAPPPVEASAARGVLRAERDAVLSSPLSERIVRMPFREGDRFNKGDALVTFDCARLAAELRAARAGAAVETRNAVVQAELLSMDATGRADADIAKLKEKERLAQAQVIQERMSGCKVLAPYSGRVVEALVRVDEAPPPNEKLIRIVSNGPLELHMVVPSKWLSWLRPDSSFSFQVDETGDVLTAKVRRISAAVDAVSQTVKVVASVSDAPAGVLPGMSGHAKLGSAKLDSAKVDAAKVDAAKVEAGKAASTPRAAPPKPELSTTAGSRAR